MLPLGSRMSPRNAQYTPCSVMPRPAPSILRTHQVIRGVAGTLGQGTCEAKQGDVDLQWSSCSMLHAACCMLHAACCKRVPLPLDPTVNDHETTATDRKRKRRRAVAIKIPPRMMMMLKFRKFAVLASPRPCSRKCRARQRSVKRNRMAKAKWRNLQARHNHAFTLHGPGVAVMRPHGHPTGTSQRLTEPHSASQSPTAPHRASQSLTAPHRASQVSQATPIALTAPHNASQV